MTTCISNGYLIGGSLKDQSLRLHYIPVFYLSQTSATDFNYLEKLVHRCSTAVLVLRTNQSYWLSLRATIEIRRCKLALLINWIPLLESVMEAETRQFVACVVQLVTT